MAITITGIDYPEIQLKGASEPLQVGIISGRSLNAIVKLFKKVVTNDETKTAKLIQSFSSGNDQQAGAAFADFLADNLTQHYDEIITFLAGLVHLSQDELEDLPAALPFEIIATLPNHPDLEDLFEAVGKIVKAEWGEISKRFGMTPVTPSKKNTDLKTKKS